MTYRAFDRFLAWRRFRVAAPHIRFQSRVCDLGCGPGAPFLQAIAPRLVSGFGIDENPGESIPGKISLISGNITARLPFESNEFDHVTMLAVLEHLAEPKNVLAEAYRLLNSGGSLIMTWPSALVDPILRVLIQFRLVDDKLGFDQHQPRIPVDRLRALLKDIGFRQIENGKFEFGLNNWLVAYRK